MRLPTVQQIRAAIEVRESMPGDIHEDDVVRQLQFMLPKLKDSPELRAAIKRECEKLLPAEERQEELEAEIEEFAKDPVAGLAKIRAEFLRDFVKVFFDRGLVTGDELIAEIRRQQEARKIN